MTTRQNQNSLSGGFGIILDISEIPISKVLRRHIGRVNPHISRLVMSHLCLSDAQENETKEKYR
jgi:hypothetical protein